MGPCTLQRELKAVVAYRVRPWAILHQLLQAEQCPCVGNGCRMPQNPWFPEHYSGSSGFGVMQGTSRAQFPRMQLLYMAHATYIMHGHVLLLELATHAGMYKVRSSLFCMPSSGCPWFLPEGMPNMWPLLAHVLILQPCTRMHLSLLTQKAHTARRNILVQPRPQVWTPHVAHSWHKKCIPTPMPVQPAAEEPPLGQQVRGPPARLSLAKPFTVQTTEQEDY